MEDGKTEGMGKVTCGLTGDKRGGHNTPSPLMLHDSGLSSGQSHLTHRTVLTPQNPLTDIPWHLLEQQNPG